MNNKTNTRLIGLNITLKSFSSYASANKEMPHEALRRDMLAIYKNKIINSYNSLPDFNAKYELLLQDLFNNNYQDPLHPSVNPYSSVNSMILELEIDTIEKYYFYSGILYTVEIYIEEYISEYPDEISEPFREEFFRTLYQINPSGLYGLIKQHLIFNYDKASSSGIITTSDPTVVISLDPLKDLNNLNINSQVYLLDYITSSRIGEGMEKLSSLENLYLKIVELVVNDKQFVGNKTEIVNLIELVLKDLYEAKYNTQLHNLRSS